MRTFFAATGMAACLAVGVILGAASASPAAEAAPPGPLVLAARFVTMQPPAIAWRWPDTLIAQRAAPRNHQVLFEDDHVALLEVTVRPGEKELLHGHKYASVFAVDSAQPKGENFREDGSSIQVDRSLEHLTLPTCSAIGPQAPHQFHNTDSFPQHFYRIEFKKLAGDSIMTAAAAR